MTDGIKSHYEVVVVGAGVSGIYQIKRLADLGVDALVLDAAPDLGGTWYWNRYPGARFDSESYTYGYSFSKELLNEWHWKERFSAQPENLRYRHSGDRRDRGQGRRVDRVPAPAELERAAQQQSDLKRRDGRHPLALRRDFCGLQTYAWRLRA